MAQLRGKTPTGWRDIDIDLITKSLVIIEHEHRVIHEGKSYSLPQSTATDAFDIAAPLTAHIVTPDTTEWTHMIWMLAASGIALFEIFEDDENASHFDISGGDVATPLNANRNSANTSGLVIKTGVTITQATADVLIHSEYLGGLKHIGSTARRLEMILEQNREYLFKFTSIADNNEGSMLLDWYEHTNET